MNRNKLTLRIGTGLIILIIAFFSFQKAQNSTHVTSDKPKATAIIPVFTPQHTPEITKEPLPPNENVDVVVFGSELEGMYLARAAADEGLRVKILDPRDQVGGQLLQGEMLFLDEAWDDRHVTMLQGRVKELFRGFQTGKIRKLPEFTTYFNTLIKDIPLESGIEIDKVDVIPGEANRQAIHTVTYRTKSKQLKQITASYYVDNTDYAALIEHLHATRLPGLEKFYKADKIQYMAATMMMKFKNVDWAKFSSYFNKLTQAQKNKQYGGGYVDNNYILGLEGVTSAFKSTNETDIHLRGFNALNQRDGDVLINALIIYSVDPSKPESIAAAKTLGETEMPLLLAHFRKNIIGWDKAELNGFPSYLYIREYNHYETEHVLSMSDLLSGRMFYDDVSIAGYPIDLQGTVSNKWGIELGRPDKYGMPLRSFLLKDYDNVIVAGKNVGASALAYGSARIQQNTSIAGETIGIILGQLQGKKKLQDLTEADWPSLHSYLESKYKIKLTGIVGKNKISTWNADEINKLNTGELVYSPEYKNGKK